MSHEPSTGFICKGSQQVRLEPRRAVGKAGWGWHTHTCVCICTQEHMAMALGRRTGNSRSWVEMGEERSVLVSSMRNTEQEPHLTGVLRGQQDHFRIRRQDSVRKGGSKDKRAVRLTPSLKWDLDGAPGAVHFSKPRKVGSQKGTAPGCRELGVRKEAYCKESKVLIAMPPS